MSERLSYRDFKKELLLAIAVEVRSETGKVVNPIKILHRISGSYNASWVLSAADDFVQEGLMKGSRYLSGGGSYFLTGAGVEYAEEIANSMATDLAELIDEDEVVLSDEKGNALVTEKGDRISAGITGVTSGPIVPAEIVTMDQTAEQFRELTGVLRELIEILRGDNEIRESAEAERSYVELKAGAEVLQAQTADRKLIDRLVVDPLKGFASEVRKNAISELAKKALALVKWLIAHASS